MKIDKNDHRNWKGGGGFMPNEYHEYIKSQGMTQNEYIYTPGSARTGMHVCTGEHYQKPPNIPLTILCKKCVHFAEECDLCTDDYLNCVPGFEERE